MADQRELVAYLREHRAQFTLEQMRAGLLEQGADPSTLDAAIAEVKGDKPPRSRKLLFYSLALLLPAFWLIYYLLPRRSANLVARPAVATAASTTPLDAARDRYRENFFDPYAHVELADALYKAGRLSDAFYVLEEARAMFPEEEFNEAHAFVITGHGRGGWPGDLPFDATASNEDALKARAAMDPKDWQSLSYLAHIAGHRGDLAGAESYVDRALKIAPDELGPLGLKAQLYAKRNDADGAMTLYEKIFNLSPQSPDRRSAIGMMTALASLGAKGGAKSKRALKNLTEWSKANPDDAELWLARAFALGARGDEAGVKALVRDGEKARPGTTALDGVKAMLAISDRRATEAVALLKGVVARDPENEFALEKLAELHRKELKDMDGALPYYIALHHGDPHYYDGEYAEFRIKRALQSRRAAVVASAKTADDLRALLKSDDGAVRAEAALAAGKLGDASLIGDLADALDDVVGNVVQNADNALFEMSKARPKEIRAARDSIVGSPRAFVRGMAMNLYCDLDREGMKPTALERLSDPSPYVRWRAYSALTGYYRDDERAQAAVKKFLADERDERLLASLRYADSKREPR